MSVAAVSADHEAAHAQMRRHGMRMADTAAHIAEWHPAVQLPSPLPHGGVYEIEELHDQDHGIDPWP